MFQFRMRYFAGGKIELMAFSNFDSSTHEYLYILLPWIEVPRAKIKDKNIFFCLMLIWKLLIDATISSAENKFILMINRQIYASLLRFELI